MSVQVRGTGDFGARESKIKVTLLMSGISLSAHRIRWRERMRFPPTSAQAVDLPEARSLRCRYGLITPQCRPQPEHRASP